MPVSFTLFETAIGRCAIAWSERGVAQMQLPERDEIATRTRILKRHPDARETPPPPAIARAATNIIALLAGEARDLSGIALDMDGVPEFHREVYAVARTIPAGATLTYGEIAAKLGDAGAARAVGEALGRNPFALIVPCHRVVAAGGKSDGFKSGGFSAHGGIATKMRLLTIEGARSDAAPMLFDHHGGLDFAVKPKRAGRNR